MAAKFAARPSATDRRATVLGRVTGRRSELLRAGPYLRVSAEPAHRRTRSAPRTGAAFADDHPGRRRKPRSEEHTSELQSRGHLVCRLLLEKKKPRGALPRRESVQVALFQRGLRGVDH